MEQMGEGRVEVTGVTRRFGATEVLRGIDLHIQPRHVCALLGPSGSGKTTLLRVIAGLEVPDSGTVAIDDRVLVGPGTFVPPERRRVGMVFQDWALFPHLSVADNVAFGLPRGERKGARVTAALEMVGLADLAARMPGTLSGGQQQRVALARALAPQPSVLLLDEPFSNLDAAMRVKVRTDVHQLLVDAGITAIFVTHDQEEAFVLGDTVAVMRDGGIVQSASPRDLYSDPVDAWLAAFVGEANFLHGEANGVTACCALGTIPLRTPASGPVDVLVRPEQVHLEPDGDAVVELVEYYGHDSVVSVRLANGALVRARVVNLDVCRGDRVSAHFRGPATRAFPAVACRD
jgi:iron(III) transport system ATP-binding protein